MEALFFLVLASQIYLLSYHYPMIMISRYHYILEHYPAKDYPKFYATDIYVEPEKIIRGRLKIFKIMNYCIAAIGICVILLAIFNDFRLNEKGGAELFVGMFFMLQFIPHMLFEIMTKKHNKHMRELFKNQKRTAELKPRHLFDFISVYWLVFAVAIFITSTILFLYYEGFDKPWGDEVYITLVVSTALNIGFAFIIFKYVNGAKLDPLQAYKDQLMVIKSITHNLVFASIMMSLFFIAINSVREFGLDKWEPILMSVYFQIIVVFGIGQMLRSIKIEDLDFEVYKTETDAKPA